MDNLAKRFPLYSRLIRLYPRAYRREYGEQMLQTLADMLDNAENGRDRVVIWLRAIIDLPLSITQQQVITAGGIMTHETPRYSKQGSLAGAVLLLPFFSALAANGLNKVFYNHDLFHSWLWSDPILLVWVILLPSLALIVSGVTFLRWSTDRRKHGRTSSWKLLTDWRHNWPMLTVLLVSLGILSMVFFHDSVHCVTGNPIREVRNLHDTLMCISNR